MEYLRLVASAWVTFVLDFLKPFGRGRDPRVLVIKLDHLGDVITALPVFPALREAMPDAWIEVLVGPWARELMENEPSIDGVLTYESRRFSRTPGTRFGFWRRLGRMRMIAGRRYSHVIELRGDSWTLLLPFLGGIFHRVDRGTVRFDDWLERNFGKPGDRTRPPKHEVETNLEIIRPIVQDLVLPPERVEIVVQEADRDALRRRTRAMDLPDGVPVVTIHPGASWRPRAWRPERFAEVSLQLLENYPGLHVCFVGSHEDRDIADRIGMLVKHPRAHYLFDLRLLETAALIERSALFIGSDSGIAHLAAACGTPSVALFGPQDPRRFRPWSGKTVVLHHPVPCFPCKQVKCVVPSNPCVNMIYVDDVLRQAEAVLGRPLPPPRPMPIPTRAPATAIR
jgi:lipopolysaccharide heptosyltransferase II